VATVEKGKYYVTIAGAEKLKNELEELEVKRSEISHAIRTAKGFGDLSENFEYHAAKKDGGMVEGRIQQLKIIIPSLAVVRPEEVSTGEVSFGAMVTVKDEDGEPWELQLVGPLEADPIEDRISYESPLGAALMGRKVGETVEADVPAGKIVYEIVDIQSYQA
jgi:transcription elongation factor GreA